MNESLFTIGCEYRQNKGYLQIDEVFVKINGEQHYLWRAVDQDGEVVDVFLQNLDCIWMDEATLDERRSFFSATRNRKSQIFDN